MANATESADIAKLQEDVAALRKDLRAIVDSFKEDARSSANGFAAKAREGVEHVGARARERAREGVSVVSEQIETRPLTSALIAFTAGLALGKLLDRR